MLTVPGLICSKSKNSKNPGMDISVKSIEEIIEKIEDRRTSARRKSAFFWKSVRHRRGRVTYKHVFRFVTKAVLKIRN